MNNDLDILLIHPNASHKIYQALSTNLSAIEPPIWAAMMATYLKKKGISVRILDCEAERLNIEASVSRVKFFNPRIVCVIVYGQQPSASTQNMVGAMMLMKALEPYDFMRVYAGPHPTALPERTITDDPKALVAMGEGVFTLEELAWSASQWRGLATIRGLAFRDEDSHKVVVTPPHPLIRDLDEVFPEMAWDELPMDKYRTANWHSWTNGNNTQPFASIYTSLGCPFQCSFCMINAPFNNGDPKQNTFRHWSPDKMIRTFDQLHDRGITNLKIADEMFVLRPNHFLALCDLIISRGYKFNIWAYSRVDTIKESYLKKLKQAGVNWLGLGIESSNFSIRSEVTKGKFQETNIVGVVNKIREFDICVGGNFMFGLPNDTLETMQNTLDMALELPLDYGNFYCTMAYPGSQLHREFSKTRPELLPENHKEIGWIGYSQHAYETFNLPTTTLSNAEILKFRDGAFHKFFTNSTYLDRMTAKFGPAFKTEMEIMLLVKLKRKLYE